MLDIDIIEARAKAELTLCDEVRRLRAELESAVMRENEETYLRAKLILMKGTSDATALSMAQSIVTTMESPEEECAHDEA